MVGMFFSGKIRLYYLFYGIAIIYTDCCSEVGRDRLTSVVIYGI